LIEEILATRIEEALRELSYPTGDSILIERPRDERHGDFACPVAFSLAKVLRKRPSAIAEEILSVLKTDAEEVKEVSVAGGFINFTISKRYFAGELERIFTQSFEYGKTDIGRGEKVMVEFVSSNPTGPLTVGHGRQAVLGDVISNLLHEVGYTVTREYYFNDAGRQMDILGRSCYARYLQEFDPSAEFPEEGYKGQYLIDIAKRAVEAYSDRFVAAEGALREEALSTLRKFAAGEIVKVIDRDLRELRITFDSWFNESSLYEEGKVDEAIRMLADAGATYEKDGALWFRASLFGDEEDRVLLKSSGDPTYFLTDIAYHINKYTRNFPLMINIHGADHHGYVPRMKAAMKALGFRDEALRYLVHQMVTFVEGGVQMKMSTRAGAFVTLKELMDKVGVDATRYFFVMRKADGHLVFDIDVAKKQSDENPVYYVQYVHARIANILEFARSRDIDTESGTLMKKFDPSLLVQNEEWALIKLLVDFPSVLRKSAVNLEPHRLTGYLEEVAAAFHNWYQNHRVVTDDESLTDSRLFLAVCVMKIIARGLAILGVSRPERM
jgi:arginyl-tRNA synthetase